MKSYFYIIHVLLSLLNIDADDEMARNTPCQAAGMVILKSYAPFGWNEWC